MPQFLHLADDRDIALIRKNGIRAQKIRGRDSKGVFATPVLQNYYQSHQWLRELRRRGTKVISAVQFRVPDDLAAAVGHYNDTHLDTTAADAVRIFMEHATGMGLEVIFAASIPADWITRTYTPDQIVGWRYYPEAHADGRRPCGCPYCQRGQIGSKKLREAYLRAEAAAGAMSAAKVFSWILLSIGEHGSNRRQISDVADGIMGFPPTQRQMDASLSWLKQRGLVLVERRSYHLTERGIALVDACRNSSRSLSETLSMLKFTVRKMLLD